MENDRADAESSREDPLDRLRACGPDAWNDVLAEHRDRLRAMIALRLDRRLQGRLDPSDVIQEAYIEATRQLPGYLDQPKMSVFLWLRLIVGQKLIQLHRKHLGARMRSAGREVSLYHGPMPEASSAAIAAQLLGRDSRPSEIAMRAERALKLEEALNRMETADLEVLTLRHFECLSNAETAQELGIHEAAASKRYVRALQRLRECLASLPGGQEI